MELHFAANRLNCTVYVNICILNETRTRCDLIGKESLQYPISSIPSTEYPKAYQKAVQNLKTWIQAEGVGSQPDKQAVFALLVLYHIHTV